ncbi:MAG: hypothetical protein A2144_04430 [Chloroflexi bacterium RBG_16_50_9]|nr:MAG: hypothetical protein A2144_04430 [Chloroflexi bacterium RBG_16_50_9]
MDTENTSHNPPSLKVESDYIDFGCLKPGEGGTMALRVSGGPGDVLVNCDQLKVMPSSFGSDDAEIQVTLLASLGGELVWDNIVLKGQSDEVAVLVTARWEGFAVPEAVPNKPLTLIPPVTTNEAPTIIGTPILSSERPWTGRRCSRCYKNFAYDASVHDWEQCKCNWLQMLINIGTQIIRELRLGIKEFPSYIQELWNVVLGKEKW